MTKIVIDIDEGGSINVSAKGRDLTSQTHGIARRLVREVELALELPDITPGGVYQDQHGATYVADKFPIAGIVLWMLPLERGGAAMYGDVVYWYNQGKKLHPVLKAGRENIPLVVSV